MTDTISEVDLRDEVVGHDLGEGSYTIDAYRAWLIADCVESPPLGDVAHPMFVYYVGQGGMGLTLDEMFALCHAHADDGVMLGSCELDLVRPLEVGERFTVTGQVDSVVRKQGSTGTFDIVTFHLDLADDTARRAARLSLSFIYPRRS